MYGQLGLGVWSGLQNRFLWFLPPVPNLPFHCIQLHKLQRGLRTGDRVICLQQTWQIKILSSSAWQLNKCPPPHIQEGRSIWHRCTTHRQSRQRSLQENSVLTEPMQHAGRHSVLISRLMGWATLNWAVSHGIHDRVRKIVPSKVKGTQRWQGLVGMGC